MSLGAILLRSLKTTYKENEKYELISKFIKTL